MYDTRGRLTEVRRCTDYATTCGDYKLYKGASARNPIGSGSTADAVRHEIATGQPIGGKFHTQKAQEYLRALEKWMSRNPNASPADRAAAKSMLDDLTNALGGG